MSEVLSAIPLVQAFAREKYEEEQFDAVTADTVRESIRIARLEAAATRSSEIITAVGTAAAAVFRAPAGPPRRMIARGPAPVAGRFTTSYWPRPGSAQRPTPLFQATTRAARTSASPR